MLRGRLMPPFPTCLDDMPARVRSFLRRWDCLCSAVIALLFSAVSGFAVGAEALVFPKMDHDKRIVVGLFCLVLLFCWIQIHRRLSQSCQACRKSPRNDCPERACPFHPNPKP